MEARGRGACGRGNSGIIGGVYGRIGLEPARKTGASSPYGGNSGRGIGPCRCCGDGGLSIGGLEADEADNIACEDNPSDSPTLVATELFHFVDLFCVSRCMPCWPP
jgi:hypothetical protein